MSAVVVIPSVLGLMSVLLSILGLFNLTNAATDTDINWKAIGICFMLAIVFGLVANIIPILLPLAKAVNYASPILLS